MRGPRPRALLHSIPASIQYLGRRMCEFSFSRQPHGFHRTAPPPYRGVKNQGDVLVVAHCSERNLRQGIVVLGPGERGVQEHNVVLCTSEKLFYKGVWAKQMKTKT